MKKIYGLAAALFLSAVSFGQTAVFYSDTGAINVAGGVDTVFITPASNAITDGVLTVYVRGDFSSASIEYLDVIDEGANVIGQATGTGDCLSTFDTTVFNVLQADINSWASNDTIYFIMDASSSVNICTPMAEMFVKLEYDTCSGGTPMPVSFTASSDSVCADGDSAVFTPSVSGGTFSGPGVIGNVFYPDQVGPGTYNITYTYYDANVGCNSVYTDAIVVENSPIGNDEAICIGDSATLSVNGAGSYIWYDSNMNQVGTGDQITVGPLTASTTYYVSFAGSKKWFIDTAYTTGYAVDHNTYTGDDRGGIAVTQNYVYINGDGNMVRYDVADMTNPIVLPQNDGIFSDLFDGQLYALLDTATSYPQGTYLSNDSVNAIVRLDDMLNPIDTVLLSQQIYISSATYKAGVFAGSGYMILYSGGTNGTFYRIGLPSGNVINLGTYALTGLQSSENWANWGIADSMAGDYYVVYRSSTVNQIDRMNLTTYATSTIQT